MLLALLLGAVGLWRFGPFGGNSERDCQGGATAEVVWRTSDEKAPHLELPYVNQIDPRVTPYVELARLRTTGTRRYGQNNDRQPRHLHQGVVDGLHPAGANAYFHAPSTPVGQDISETVTSAVLAHPGPIKRALRDRYFAGGRAAMVFQLTPGGGAERSGLRVNDLVVRFGDQRIDGDLPASCWCGPRRPYRRAGGSRWRWCGTARSAPCSWSARASCSGTGARPSPSSRWWSERRGRPAADRCGGHIPSGSGAGLGGFGTTYVARREGDERAVLVKVLRLDRMQQWKALELFRREAEVLRQLSHPGIPAYLDEIVLGSEEAPGESLVEELVPGTKNWAG